MQSSRAKHIFKLATNEKDVHDVSINIIFMNNVFFLYYMNYSNINYRYLKTHIFCLTFQYHQLLILLLAWYIKQITISITMMMFLLSVIYQFTVQQ